MKTRLSLLFLAISVAGCAQQFRDVLTRELRFEKPSEQNALILANINGEIRVEAYDGDKILIEATRTISAKTNERLEKGKQEVGLEVIDQADTLIVFTSEGCQSFEKQHRWKSGEKGFPQGWGYSWNCHEKDCRQLYNYTVDFHVRVPAHVQLLVSTVNDGDIVVTAAGGSVKAANVNGSIRIANLEKEAIASTVNGDVEIAYRKNPQSDCRFYSLNGDINAYVQPGLAANVSFESYNGSFYTDINHLETLPARLEKTQTEKGVSYKIGNNRYQVRSGGVLLDFETFNGNVYLKEGGK